MNKRVLVLNLGMKSIRSIIFDEKGNRLSSASHLLATGLNESCVVQDTNEWWTGAAKVIHESINLLADKSIDYMTVTASASCLVYVDETCNALDKCIMVSDKRAVEESKEIAELASFQTIKEKLDVNINAGSMPARMLWVKKHQPAIFKRVRHFLAPNDFLIARLTGKYITDVFNAQKLFYAVDEGGYPTRLYKDLGISIELLPQVSSVGTVVGEVKSAAADFLGLPPGVNVILTTYDAICSFWGSGVTEEGEASDVSGTVTVLRALTYRETLNPSQAVYSIPYAEKNCHIVGGSNNLGGGLIEWVKQCYYNREEFPYEIMERDASESTIGAGGLFFLPYLLGERAPIWDDSVRGCFFGLERYHSRKDMTRAVFESTGFIDMDFINEIEKTGVSVKSIRASGGLARFQLISQIKSDVTGKEILVLSDFETTSAGAAMLVFENLGVLHDMFEAAKLFSEVRMVIKPSYKNHIKYQKIYGMFKQIYAETKELFKERLALYQDIYQVHNHVVENI